VDKMSSRQYYHDTKFNWNKGKQQQSYKRHQEWLDYSSNMQLEELKSNAKYSLNHLDMALQLHFISLFENGGSGHVYTSKKYLKRFSRVLP